MREDEAESTRNLVGSQIGFPANAIRMFKHGCDTLTKPLNKFVKGIGAGNQGRPVLSTGRSASFGHTSGSLEATELSSPLFRRQRVDLQLSESCKVRADALVNLGTGSAKYSCVRVSRKKVKRPRRTSFSSFQRDPSGVIWQGVGSYVTKVRMSLGTLLIPGDLITRDEIPSGARSAAPRKLGQFERSPRKKPHDQDASRQKERDKLKKSRSTTTQTNRHNRKGVKVPGLKDKTKKPTPPGASFEIQRTSNKDKYALDWTRQKGNSVRVSLLSSGELSARYKDEKNEVAVKAFTSGTQSLNFRMGHVVARIEDVNVKSDERREDIPTGKGTWSPLNITHSKTHALKIKPSLAMKCNWLRMMDAKAYLHPDGAHGVSFATEDETSTIKLALAKKSSTPKPWHASLPLLSILYGIDDTSCATLTIDGYRRLEVGHNFSKDEGALTGSVSIEIKPPAKTIVRVNIANQAVWGTLSANSSTAGNAEVQVGLNLPKPLEGSLNIGFESAKARSLPNFTVRGLVTYQ